MAKSPPAATAPTNPHLKQKESIMPDTTVKPSTTLAIAVAWLVVIVPAGWGIYNTALKAANLFK